MGEVMLVSADIPVTEPASNVVYNCCIVIIPLLIILLGLLISMKKVGKGRKLNTGLKVLSFIIPFVGLWLYFKKEKEDKEIAIDYLKICIAGVITYCVIYVSLFVIVVIHSMLSGNPYCSECLKRYPHTH